MAASHRFSNALRYRGDDHEMQRQLTPPYVLEPVRAALSGIELDPCTEQNNPCGADRFYTPPQDGAAEAWDARSIYVNPPYSKARERWVARCQQAGTEGRATILLMPAHTDTRLFSAAAASASWIIFIRGRVKFGVLRSNGRQEAASHPSCLIGWNVPNVHPLLALGLCWHRPPMIQTAGEKHGS